MNEFFDLEAEAAVIKSCLRFPEATGDAIGMGLKADHFSPPNALIFAAVVAVAEGDAPMSTSAVVRQLMANGTLAEAGGQTAVSDIWSTGDTGLTFYGTAVLEWAKVRREYNLARQYLERLTTPNADIAREMATFRDSLLSASDADIQQDGPRSIREILEGGAMERLSEWAENPRAIRGIHTGFQEMDRLLGGLARGRMSVVGAATSAGKTQWMQHIARFASVGGHPTLLLSTEMSAADNVFRWAFMEAGFDRLTAERQGMSDETKQRFFHGVYTLAERPLFAWEMGGYDLARIRLAVRRMKARHGIKLVMLDMVNGLELPIAKGQNMAQALGDQMAGLHALAVGEDIHLMATAHVNRAAMQRLDVIGLNDFRDSAAVEQWADQAFMLMPVDEKGQVITREQANADVAAFGQVRVLANICKNRFGSLGTVYMNLNWDVGGKYVEERAS